MKKLIGLFAVLVLSGSLFVGVHLENGFQGIKTAAALDQIEIAGSGSAGRIENYRRCWVFCGALYCCKPKVDKWCYTHWAKCG